MPTRLNRAELPRGPSFWRRMWLENSERSRSGDVGDGVLYRSLSHTISKRNIFHSNTCLLRLPYMYNGTAHNPWPVIRAQTLYFRCIRLRTRSRHSRRGPSAASGQMVRKSAGQTRSTLDVNRPWSRLCRSGHRGVAVYRDIRTSNDTPYQIRKCQRFHLGDTHRSFIGLNSGLRRYCKRPTSQN